ncbi:MAG: CarD family transcriptional regulator [Myxococcales bacterium]|nr:CarD family transcriptional regulator [Myxococcales bacterium]MCB9523035.1 CarD family transcriptional regulator [Myxococcales bacterium]
MERFSVGDLAVYQDQGVGQITDVGRLELAGASLEVYTVVMQHSGAIVRVPTHKAAAVGLRGLTPRTQVGSVFEILRSKAEKPREKTWNRRYRVYTERLRTGELGEIAKVLRDLEQLRRDKDELSYGERQMLEQARGLVVQEVAKVTGRDESEVADEVAALCRTQVAA